MLFCLVSISSFVFGGEAIVFVLLVFSNSFFFYEYWVCFAHAVLVP
jgi:hypothetical protein